MFVYILLIVTIALWWAFFLIFRRYIQSQLGKVEYVRRVENELQQLLLDVNRSAEDITLVIEDRSQQLRDLLEKADKLLQDCTKASEKAGQQNYNLQQNHLRLRELKESAESALERFQLRLVHWEEQLSHSRKEAYLSIGAKLEEELSQELSLKLQHKLDTELQALQEQAIQMAKTMLKSNLEKTFEAAVAEQSYQLSAVPSSPKAKLQENKLAEGENIINAQLRSEIELYIEQDLDALVISKKTGVPLNLVEIMVSMKTADSL